jgi:hypothetical protein
MNPPLGCTAKQASNQIHRNRAHYTEKKIEMHLFGISSNTSRVCPLPATGAAAAAALIAVSEAFFAGALFTTGGIVAGFFGRCLGIGGVLATGRTGGVEGTLATGPTWPAAGSCPCPTT